MPKFAPASEYAPPPVELTPNRAALVALNEARAEAAAEVTALRARTNKLAKLKESVAALESELSQTLAVDGKQLEDWAMSDTGEPAPRPDSAKRVAIEAKLADARSQALAADAATASVESVLARANQRAAELEHRVPAAVANVLLDCALDLLPSITEAAAELAKRQRRYESLRSFLLERAEASRAHAMESRFFRAIELLDREASRAHLPPPPNGDASLEWKSMAQALGDTAILPTPAPVAMFPGMPEVKW